MPLSEHEQRLLEEMERNLYQNDADFVAKVGGRQSKPGYRAVVLGILLAVVGVAVLITGVFVQLAVVGILGFVVMLAGVLLAVAPPRRLRNAPPDIADSGTTNPHPGQARPGQGNSGTNRQGQGGFMDKLNDRWDKRQDGHN
jgi:hypothetical protein